MSVYITFDLAVEEIISDAHPGKNTQVHDEKYHCQAQRHSATSTM